MMMGSLQVVKIGVCRCLQMFEEAVELLMMDIS
jgi:hypothetical protein